METRTEAIITASLSVQSGLTALAGQDAERELAEFVGERKAKRMIREESLKRSRVSDPHGDRYRE